MTKQSQIENIFIENGGIARLKDITQKNINKYHLYKMVKNGRVERIKQGLYKLTEYPTDEHVDVMQLVPSGIFCLYSAWYYHGLSTYVPYKYHVAIEKKNKVKLPEYPPIKLYYRNKSSLELGVALQEETQIQITDKEKSICDAMRFRNKIGIDLFREVISNYIESKERNMEKLLSYAKHLKIKGLMQNYLEILI